MYLEANLVLVIKKYRNNKIYKQKIFFIGGLKNIFSLVLFKIFEF